MQRNRAQRHDVTTITPPQLLSDEYPQLPPLLGAITPPNFDRYIILPLTSTRSNPHSLGDGLPPPHVIQAATNDFFAHCHNQPLSVFQEQRFRQQLEHDLVPQYLLLVVLASACRFSQHPFFTGRRDELISRYSRLSWNQLVARWLSERAVDTSSVVQAILLHCLIDIAGMRDP